MRPDPACDLVTAALVAGEPPDPAHLAGCVGCRERAALVGAWTAPAPVDAAPPPPTVAALRAGARARATRRAIGGGIVGTGLALAAAALLSLRAPAPLPAEVDLLAALDDAEADLGAPPADDLLALLDPLADPHADDPRAPAPLPGDPSAPDPLLDALLGEGSL